MKSTVDLSLQHSGPQWWLGSTNFSPIHCVICTQPGFGGVCVRCRGFVHRDLQCQGLVILLCIRCLEEVNSGP